MKKSNILFVLTHTLFCIYTQLTFSQKLTREEAQKIFLANHHNPWVEYEPFKLEDFGNSRNEGVLQKAVNAGLLNVHKDSYAEAFGTLGGGRVYSLTKKSDPYTTNIQAGLYGVSRFYAIIGCGQLARITGIKVNEQEGTAIVEYRWIYKSLTPFGEILGFKTGDTSSVLYKIKMSLYDDGWRLEEREEKGTPPTDYSIFNKKGEFVSPDVNPLITIKSDYYESKETKPYTDKVIITSDTAYFYDAADIKTLTSNFVKKGTILTRTKETINFYGCYYINRNKETITGYIRKVDLQLKYE